MRARFVNEVQNFERGQDPKKSMGIGGINLFDQYEDKIDDLEAALSMTKLSASEEWGEHLRKLLVGKTITANMNKLPSISNKGIPGTKYERGEFTITIQDVKPGESLEDALDRNFQVTPQLILADEKNNIYSMKIIEGEKIYFE
jgi:hypothetical protein